MAKSNGRIGITAYVKLLRVSKLLRIAIYGTDHGQNDSFGWNDLVVHRDFAPKLTVREKDKGVDVLL